MKRILWLPTMFILSITLGTPGLSMPAAKHSAPTGIEDASDQSGATPDSGPLALATVVVDPKLPSNKNLIKAPFHYDREKVKVLARSVTFPAVIKQGEDMMSVQFPTAALFCLDAAFYAGRVQGLIWAMDRETVVEHELHWTIDDADDLFNSCLKIVLLEAVAEPNTIDKSRLNDVKEVVSEQIQMIQETLRKAQTVKIKATLAVATEASPKPVVEPVNLGPVINTKLRQAEPSFTADGKTMYFNCRVRPDRAGDDICVSYLSGTLEDGRWTTPEVVAPGVISLNETREVEPVISPDGKKLYFISINRPGGYGRSDIWYSENVDGVWQAPKNLGSPFNTPFKDHCLFFSADGNEAFWTSTRPGGFGGNDIWTSRRVDGVWQPAVNLGPNVNSPYSDHHSIPSPDGKSLYVTSGRPGGFGGQDIYVTTRDHTGAWGPLVNLGSLVNSDKHDRCPAFTPDFRIFLFDSEREGGYGSKDLWWVYYDKIKHIR